MPIPHVDPMAVPAPIWLVRTLLLATFGLHLLFMNVLFGGTVVALVCSVRRKASKHAAQLASDLAHLLPPAFAFTITLGVAPLLFLQVIYGHLLYTSSILMAVPWLSVIGLVMLAYYGVYYVALRGEHHPSVAATVLGAAVLLLAAVGFIYSNNFTLMLTPGKWLDLYRTSAKGWNLNLAEPTLLPRYLHFVLGALAMSGAFLVALGFRKRETGYGRWLMEHGARSFTTATILNYAVGFWFFLRIPLTARAIFSGQNGVATVALALGVLLPPAAIMHFAMISKGKAVVRNASIGIASAILSVAAMVIVRDTLRTAYLAPYFRLTDLKTAPQWGVIALFLAVFLGGVLTLAFMLRAVAVARPQSAAGAAAAAR